MSVRLIYLVGKIFSPNWNTTLKVLALFSGLLVTFVLVQLLQQVAPITKSMDEIMFNFQQLFLLAEEAVNNQLVLHFPSFDNSVPQYYTDVKLKLDDLWNYSNYGCNLEVSNITEMNSSNDWIYEATRMEHIRTQDEFRRLKMEPGEMFPIIQPSKSRRTRRCLLLIAAGLLVSAAAGLCLRSFCLLKDISGGCDQMSKEKKRADNGAIQRKNSMYSWQIRVPTVTNQKFYVVGSDVKEHRRTQSQMASIRRDNAQTMVNQLQIFKDSVTLLGNDAQEIYIREETTHNVAVLSSILCCFHSILQIFRASFHTFRTNIFRTFARIVNGFLPLSVSQNSALRTNLRKVVLQGNETGSRLTLAFPIWSLLTYYETKLSRQAVPSEFELVFTLAVPFCSKATVLQVYHAIKSPMLNKDNANASLWDFETGFLVVPLQSQEPALLTAHDFSQCIVLTAYSVCCSGFAIEKSEDSCFEICTLKTRWQLWSLVKSSLFTFQWKIKLLMLVKATGLSGAKHQII